MAWSLACAEPGAKATRFSDCVLDKKGPGWARFVRCDKDWSAPRLGRRRGTSDQGPALGLPAVDAAPQVAGVQSPGAQPHRGGTAHFVAVDAIHQHITAALAASATPGMGRSRHCLQRLKSEPRLLALLEANRGGQGRLIGAHRVLGPSR